ncbi:MAG TPA: methylated-DNA--[protein]-cysteine S-methyltransferase [bacterium]|nr:methylated-DNA--[protein]-cysteine S-methyltransferase [bacterium]HOL47468.1 methylated-DNA--[protein]-cysteine S-methyltransferase [bacterium]HPQ18948.1 methylated-DNA--[protein]-cysteine S-methyltransferase [bacterium]
MKIEYYTNEIIPFIIKYQYSESGLQKIWFIKNKNKEIFEKKKNKFNKEFDNYFLKRKDIGDLPIDINLTELQLKVLLYLRREIKFGLRITYSELAKKIFNSKNYARFIGNTMHINPLPLYFPCHRVIGLNNEIKNYSQGIEYKKFLLNFEK